MRDPSPSPLRAKNRAPARPRAPRAGGALATLSPLSRPPAPRRRSAEKALINLFKLLGGPYWTNNDGWDPDGGTDPCEVYDRWYGVGCIDPCDIYRDGPSCAFGRITALTLRDNNLTGSLTNWTGVGDLHNLSWVDLSVNYVSGSIPAEFGQIKNIEVLNMAFNSLQGTLPTTLGAMNGNGYAELNELSLEFNSLVGTLPSEVGLLTKLRMLNVAFNSLEGSIPPQYTNLTELQARPRAEAARRETPLPPSPRRPTAHNTQPLPSPPGAVRARQRADGQPPRRARLPHRPALPQRER